MRRWMRELIRTRTLTVESYLKVCNQIDASHREDYGEVLDDPWYRAAMAATGGFLPDWYDPWSDDIGRVREVPD